VVASDAAPRPDGAWLFPAGDAAALARAIRGALAAEPRPPSDDDHFAPLLDLYERIA
jgi:hypothetical protein